MRCRPSRWWAIPTPARRRSSTGSTREGAEASDALFVTLDPLVRRVRLPDRRELLVSDTVGFIDRLPHSLVAAFRATLEEVTEADLVLHVIDAASPERERHVGAVQPCSSEIGASDVERLDVYNKCDLLDAGELARLRHADPAALYSRRGEATAAPSCSRRASRVALDVRRVTLEFDAHASGRRRTACAACTGTRAWCAM